MITGFTIQSVEGKIESPESLAKQRFPRINVNIEDVKSEHEKVTVSYSFIAEYYDSDTKNQKSVGQMKLAGIVEIKDTKEKMSNIMKVWDEKKILPTDIAEEVMNGLNFRCSATGTLVAYSLGLIPPLGISQIKIQEESQSAK
ncbi:MAG: hypothetical protein M1385_01405 [Candidatus Marsarchaeota archaeon]|nr:hypothetical protein [Candidatus Marsarchaeota archaeon]